MPKIKVLFCLSSTKDTVNFNMITKKLGIIPMSTRKKSDFPIQSIDLGIALNEWAVWTKNNYCVSVSEKIDEIQNLFIGKEETIKALIKDYELTVTLSVIVEMEIGEEPEMFLTQKNIKFMSQINAEIGFDLYIV